MLRHRAYGRVRVALILISMTLFAGSSFGQSPAPGPDNKQKEVTTAETPRSDLESEITNLKAENAIVRDLLRKMEDQQKILLVQVERLQQRLDGVSTANAQPAAAAPGSPQVADFTTPARDAATTPVPATSP